MGPFELADFTGLDTKVYVADALDQSFGVRFRSSQSIRNLVAAGHLGRKEREGVVRLFEEVIPFRERMLHAPTRSADYRAGPRATT